MPVVDQNLDIHKGRDKTFLLETIKENGKPEDSTGWTIVMNVKLAFESPALAITKTSDISGQIDFSVDPDNNLWEIKIVAADTTSLSVGTYEYGISGQEPSGGPKHELAHGKFKIKPVVE